MAYRPLVTAFVGVIILLFVGGCAASAPGIYTSKPEKNVVLKAKVGEVVYENSYVRSNRPRVHLMELPKNIFRADPDCDLEYIQDVGQTCFISSLRWLKGHKEPMYGYVFVDNNNSGYFTKLFKKQPADEKSSAFVRMELDHPIQYQIVDSHPYNLYKEEYFFRIIYTGIKDDGNNHKYATFKFDDLQWHDFKDDDLGMTISTVMDYKKRLASNIIFGKSNSIDSFTLDIFDGTNDQEIEYMIKEYYQK